MIRKFITIKGVGKFTDFNASGDTEFSETNIIYGENAKGKTTLSDILRSVKENDPLIIKGRKSFDVSEKQSISLRIYPEKQLTFSEDTGWNDYIDNLEIFDIFFINENVYSGMNISREQKENLHNFVIGADSKKIRIELGEIKKEIENVNQLAKDKEREIKIHLKGYFNIEDFLDIPLDNNIDKRIEQQTKYLETAKVEKDIETKPLYKEISRELISIDFEEIKDVLKYSLTSISSDFAEKVEKHKEWIGKEEQLERWLEYGYEHIKDNLCPFCKQDLSGAQKLIEAYSNFFSAEYRRLTEEIEKVLNEAFDSELRDGINEIEKIMLENNQVSEFWNKHIDVEVKTKKELPGRDSILKYVNELLKQLRKKKSYPLEVIENDAIDNLKSLLVEYRNFTDEYNEKISQANYAIQKIKKDKLDTTIEENKLEKLKLTKNRHKEPLKGLCEEYLRFNKKKDELKKNKEEKQHNLEERIEQVFYDFGGKINEYLEQLEADFRIEDLRNQYTRSPHPFIGFVLKFADKGVSFEDNREKPCIKNTLSEGDKNTLALAFFMAKLEIEKNLSNKIVIFDDPLSSFDENKRNTTVNILKHINTKVKQLIILTHNKLLARELWEKLNNGTVKPLSIIRNGSTSAIKEWDIETSTAGEHFNDYKKLYDYLNQGLYASEQERKDVAGAIRRVLEGYLRAKFPQELKGVKTLGDMLGRIRENTEIPINDGDSSYFILDELNSYSSPYVHGSGYSVVESELNSKVQKTIDFLHQ